METAYRIKQIQIPLKSGELIVFYPQINGEEKEITGKLWWKKTIVKEVWRFFYEIGKQAYVDYENLQDDFSKRDRLLYFNTLFDAENFVKHYKIKLEEDSKKLWKQNSANWDDERLVKYYKLNN